MTAGRPTVFSDEVLQKLEDAFKLGCSDVEACLNADISTSSLYNYQNANPKFLERKQVLKETPVFIARESVIRDMKEDGALALKYLERKKKDEFSLKSEVDLKADHTISELSAEEVDERLAKLVEKHGEDLSKLVEELGK